MPTHSSVPPELRTALTNLLQRDPHGAFDLAKSFREKFSDDLYLRQVQANALSRAGSPIAALNILKPLYAEGRRDPETLGLLGSAWKQIARASAPGEIQKDALQRSRSFCLEGLTLAESAGDFQGHYPGINAAALNVFLGEFEMAVGLAKRAVNLAAKAPLSKIDYWVVATQAEGALIQRDLTKACDLYVAAQAHRPTYAQIATTRRQARRLAELLKVESEKLEVCFKIPPVLVFVGHMMDAEGRAQPRFPDSMEAAVAANLKAVITRHGAVMGLASAARGGDILFLEALNEKEVDTRIVLPLEEGVFCQASVLGSKVLWKARYEEVLARARSVRVANHHSSAADGTAFEYGTRMLLGIARLKAEQLDTDLRAIVLWDGKPGDGHGGTAWAVSHLLERGITMENVFPGLEKAHLECPPSKAEPLSLKRPILALLFSDCKGYSKLREEEIATYTKALLAVVASLIEEAKIHGRAPIVSNTWGDGLFMVFDDVSAAGVFAAALRDACRLGVRELGLPPEVILRIGLHAGPVTPFDDPVTGRLNFAGMNVAFAARIEPIAPENQVCVSEAFAALAADADAAQFQFEYLGATPFAKDFGTFPLYQLERKSK